jgi:hypothetical protein
MKWVNSFFNLIVLKSSRGDQKPLFILLHSNLFGLYYDLQTREPVEAPAGGGPYSTATIGALSGEAFLGGRPFKLILSADQDILLGNGTENSPLVFVGSYRHHHFADAGLGGRRALS